MQKEYLLKCFHHTLTLCFISLFQIAGDVVHSLAIGERYHDTFINVSLVLIDLTDDRPCGGADTLGLTVESLHHCLECLLFQLFTMTAHKLFIAERHLHGKEMEELLLATLIVVGLDNVDHTVPKDIGYVHTDALTHEGMAAFLVDDGTLFVHHIIIFEQAFTYSEVVLLYLLLSFLDAA